MLDPEIPEERREQIASEARTRIESGGELKHDTSWGMRKLAYEIRQRTEAEYRLFRFQTQGGLLDELDHNLRIADGVLRFRIFKVEPGSPAIAPPAPLASSASAPARGSRRSTGAPARGEPERDAEQSPEPAAAPPAASKGDAEEPAPPAASKGDAEEPAPPAASKGDAEGPEPPAEQGSEPQAAE